MSEVKFKNKTHFKMGLGFEDPWTKVPNIILDEKDISAKALGIYVKIIRFQNASEHNIYISSLAKQLKEGRDAITSAVNELIELGYIEREMLRNEKGRIEGYCYVVHAYPLRKNIENTTNSPYSENPLSDYPISDNHEHKRKINIKENIIKENKVVVVVSEEKNREEKVLNLYKEMKLEKRVMPHTIKLIKSYIDKFDYEVFEEVFISSAGSNISNVYKYIKQVFQELEEKNIRTIHDYELDYKSYKNKKRQSAKAESQTNNNTIIPYNKNKFHNFTSNHPKYTEKEILEKQSKKFNN